MWAPLDIYIRETQRGSYNEQIITRKGFWQGQSTIGIDVHKESWQTTICEGKKCYGRLPINTAWKKLLSGFPAHVKCLWSGPCGFLFTTTNCWRNRDNCGPRLIPEESRNKEDGRRDSKTRPSFWARYAQEVISHEEMGDRECAERRQTNNTERYDEANKRTIYLRIKPLLRRYAVQSLCEMD